MVKMTASWTLAGVCPIPDARPAGFQGTSVPMAPSAYGHIGLGDIAGNGVTRDKDATSGGTAWGPPV
jgi:hypothetical protein